VKQDHWDPKERQGLPDHQDLRENKVHKENQGFKENPVLRENKVNKESLENLNSKYHHFLMFSGNNKAPGTERKEK
jgi:hypothetical protein